MVSKIRKIAQLVQSLIRYSLYSFGIVLLLLILLAFTSVPFWMRYRLGTSFNNSELPVETIVLMGGGGFPSNSVLMRSYYTAELSKKFPEAKIVIAIPGNIDDSVSTIFQTRSLLIQNFNIDSTRIFIENKGLNTRHQALQINELVQQKVIQEPIVIVSSTEHCYRVVKSFRKIGLTKTHSQPTINSALETNLNFDLDEVGKKNFVPEIGSSTSIRYKFWNYLAYEINILREYMAIVYYKMNGWI